MKETDLIKNLSSELKPFKMAEDLSTFLVKWSGCTLVIMIIAYFSLPARADIMTEMETLRFHLENFFWFVASLSSGIAFYFSAFPERMKNSLWIPAVFSLVALLLIIFSGIRTETLTEEFHGEFSLWRGRCGFIITGISLIHAGFLGNWARRAAPRNGGLTGCWAALSASAMGCLFMQIVCTHQNTVHLLLWHFLPLTVMCFAGQRIGRTLFRW